MDGDGMSDGLRIVVCVKQVPDTTDVRVDPKTGTLVREGMPAVLNPFDHFAVEEAVRVRDEVGGEVTVLSMGPPQARSAVMRCLALGADRGVLLCDRALAGSDTLATSYALWRAIETLGGADLMVCGMQAVDGDTAQVGPGLAARLGVPQIAYAERISVSDPDGTVRARRTFDDVTEEVEAPLPALVTMTTPSNFRPTNPPFSRIRAAARKPYVEWTARDIDADPGHIGLEGSPTWVVRVYAPERKGDAERIEGPPDDVVERLVGVMRREGFL